MANIAISELDTETTSLGDNDLLLVSKDNGGSYTSAKMRGSALKSGVGGCQFSEDSVKNALTAYNAANIDSISLMNNTIDAINYKIDMLTTKQNSAFEQITELVSKIGNKIYESSTSDEFTLTLTKSGNFGSTADPTGGGTYKKGTRVYITASEAEDGYMFLGWYNDNVLVTTNSYYSWEIVSDTTLTAKYDVLDNNGYMYLNIENHSDYDVTANNYSWTAASMGYSDIVPSKTNNAKAKYKILAASHGYFITGAYFFTEDSSDIAKIYIMNDSNDWGAQVYGERCIRFEWKRDDHDLPADRIMPGVFTIMNK